MQPVKLTPKEEYDLGYLFFYGESMEQNYHKAFKWLYSAASQEYSEAYYLTGLCLLRGLGVEIDEKEGLNWLHKAAWYGNYDAAWTEAEWLLAHKKFNTGMRALRYAAEKGEHPVALCCLADRYYYGGWMPHDKKMARKLYKKSAEKGYPLAMYNLGKAYENGEGGKKNLKKAFKYYVMAAEKGLNEAANDVGIFYAKGILGPVESDMAFSYFDQAAADRTYSPAVYNLARCYEEGFGVEKNLVTAKILKDEADKIKGPDEDFVIV